MARKALRFSEGKTRDSLDSDELYALAVVRLLEIVGEAATNVEKEVRELLPQVPWTSVVGMRNRLIHGYRYVNYDRVWTTIEDDLPSLVLHLEQILESPETKNNDDPASE